MISVATVSALILPFLQTAEGFVMVIFAGAAIGSLIPDVDAQDAAVFHENIRGLNGEFGEIVNKMIGPLLPIFGFTTKYAIYKPAVIAFDFFTEYEFQEKHRTFSHSFLGVFTMTLMTGLYMIPVLIIAELFAPVYLLAFLTAYMAGAFLHMLEDSCTKTGIEWNSPFSDTKLKGDISTGKDVKKPRYFLYYLGLVAFFSFMGSVEYGIPLWQVTGGTVIALAFGWLVFMKAVAKVELDR
jgi:membrane-bound metal-dependent hydrolase YbcI (DUF457 family)